MSKKSSYLKHYIYFGMQWRPYTIVKAKVRWKNLESIETNPVLPAKSVFYIMIQKSVIGARIWFKYKTASAHATYTCNR